MASGPRKGKMKASPKAKVIASSKGVIHSPLGRPGNQAFDNVVRKIKANPGKYTYSGMGSHTNNSDKH